MSEGAELSLFFSDSFLRSLLGDQRVFGALASDAIEVVQVGLLAPDATHSLHLLRNLRQLSIDFGLLRRGNESTRMLEGVA